MRWTIRANVTSDGAFCEHCGEPVNPVKDAYCPACARPVREGWPDRPDLPSVSDELEDYHPADDEGRPRQPAASSGRQAWDPADRAAFLAGYDEASRSAFVSRYASSAVAASSGADTITRLTVAEELVDQTYDDRAKAEWRLNGLVEYVAGANFAERAPSDRSREAFADLQQARLDVAQARQAHDRAVAQRDWLLTQVGTVDRPPLTPIPDDLDEMSVGDYSKFIEREKDRYAPYRGPARGFTLEG